MRDYLNLVKGTSKQPSTSYKLARGINAGSFNANGWVRYNYYLQVLEGSSLFCFLTTRRAYPDVALLADNYKFVVNGRFVYRDGTGASNIVMAAFVSLVNAQRKSKGMSTMGLMTPFLYKYYANFTNDITSGDNKCSAALSKGNRTCCNEGFYATDGWDPVTG